MTTRMKGKERMLSDAELEEQLNKLKEEKLQCKMMHQRIQAKKAMLQQDRAPRAAPEAMTAHGSGVIRPRSQPIVVDDLYHGNTDKEEEGKYQQVQYHRRQNRKGPRTPLRGVRRAPLVEAVQFGHPAAIRRRVRLKDTYSSMKPC